MNNTKIKNFDTKTIESLKYYVYMLLDPTTDEPFYVGKGKENRVFDHLRLALKDGKENCKYDEIKRIINSGHTVKHLIVRHGLNEKTAIEIEASLIDTFKYIPKFKSFISGNKQVGIKSIEKGIMTTDDIKRLYNAKPLKKLKNDCIIININTSYKRVSGEDTIYKATKETWGIKKERLKDINYVLSEYKGLIVEVFKVNKWYPKQREYNKNAKKYGKTYTGYGFEGEVAKDEIRDLYINKTIKDAKKRGFASVLIFPETLEKLYNN